MSTDSVSHEAIRFKLADLDSAIKSDHPRMAGILREIHQAQAKDPELVTILSEEEIGILVSGLEKHKNIHIVQALAKKKSGASGKALKSTTVDDL